MISPIAGKLYDRFGIQKLLLAGAFGSALFVAVVNVVAASTSQTVGMRVAFMCMGGIGVIELVLGSMVSRPKNN